MLLLREPTSATCRRKPRFQSCNRCVLKSQRRQARSFPTKTPIIFKTSTITRNISNLLHLCTVNASFHVIFRSFSPAIRNQMIQSLLSRLSRNNSQKYNVLKLLNALLCSIWDKSNQIMIQLSKGLMKLYIKMAHQISLNSRNIHYMQSTKLLSTTINK